MTNFCLREERVETGVQRLQDRPPDVGVRIGDTDHQQLLEDVADNADGMAAPRRRVFVLRAAERCQSRAITI